MSNGFRRGRRSSSVPAKRQKSWELGPGQLGVQTAISTSSQSVFTAGSAATQDGLTLLRLRGQLTLTMSVAASALVGFSGAFGIGIVTAQAFAVGISAIPTPIIEQDWDGWLYWSAFALFASSGVGNERLVLDEPVDTKAMRKMREGDTIYAAIEVQEVSTAVMTPHFDSRILIALS